MERVLVTGGTGNLGKEIVSRLVDAGYTVRVMSRRQPSSPIPEGMEWAVADLSSGDGVAASVTGVDVIIHAATDPLRHAYQVDVSGTRSLLEEASKAGARHIIFPSIIGIDHIPYFYYRHKLTAERMIKGSEVPYSILRASQFHTLIDSLMSAANRLPIMLLPTDFQSQPLDAGEMAEYLVAQVGDGPGATLPQLAGPEILTFGEMARAWLEVRGFQKPIVHVPLPGKVAKGFRRGDNTSIDARRGTLSWAEWLAKRYSSSSARLHAPEG